MGSVMSSMESCKAIFGIVVLTGVTLADTGYGPPPPPPYHPPAYHAPPPPPPYHPPPPPYHAPEPAPAYHAPIVHPAPSYHPEPVYPEEPSPYNYEYGVHDDYTGTTFNAGEHGDGHGNVEGSYSVALPDGRIQHVSYHSDPYGGYVAEVTYEGTAQYQEPAYHPTPSYQAK